MSLLGRKVSLPRTPWKTIPLKEKRRCSRHSRRCERRSKGSKNARMIRRHRVYLGLLNRPISKSKVVMALIDNSNVATPIGKSSIPATSHLRPYDERY